MRLKYVICLLLATSVYSDTKVNSETEKKLLDQIHKLEDVVEKQDKMFKSFRDDSITSMDHIWLLLCGALVMFMQSGFAMLEAGSCRAKNTQNLLLKNLVDTCLGTLAWYLVGYAFAYGNPSTDDSKPIFIGSTNFAASGFSNADVDGNQDGGLSGAGTTPQLNWFFQWAFCATAATIVSGGIAERMKFPAYCLFSFLITAFIYPVVVAWTWGGGWLASEFGSNGYMDFAGSGVVHMVGGVGALVGAILVGSRDGRWEEGNEHEFAPHSLPLVVLGTFGLWFGWYGFNCGSTLSMHSATTAALAAQVALNTTLAAATGGMIVFLIRLTMLRRYDVAGMCNGILAGLVSVTAGCGNIESGSAVAIALIGGIFYQGASMLLRKLKIDDPLDAFPIHGVCGMWGVLAAAFFDWGKGWDFANGWNGWECIKKEGETACEKGAFGDMLLANFVGIIAISTWVVVLSIIILLPLRLSGHIRAGHDTQARGMDAKKHFPENAYMMENPVNQPETVKPVDQAAV